MEGLPYESNKRVTSQNSWEIITTPEEEKQPSAIVHWELIDTDDETTVGESKRAISIEIPSPSSLKEAEALLDNIPLKQSDYESLLNHSYAVPTASVLRKQDWRIKSSIISPFKSASGTGNQNYAIQLDYGLSNTLQSSFFYSEADDPLNTQIKDFNIPPANFWEVYGTALRWQLHTNQSLLIALNGSIEMWTVGSGGSDSLVNNLGKDASPNIFNDSGERVTTDNLVGSLALPITWRTNKQWQFTLSSGISFLPSSQGRGQGGSGEFFGTIPYVMRSSLASNSQIRPNSKYLPTTW